MRFKRSSMGKWEQVVQLQAGLKAGSAVALQGNVAIVGARGEDGDSGSVYVYAAS